MIANSFAGGFFCAKEGRRRQEKIAEESSRFTFNVLRLRFHVSFLSAGSSAEDMSIK